MKQYLKPYMEILHAEAVEMMAISLQDGQADPDKPILSKENNDWDIWEE